MLHVAATTWALLGTAFQSTALAQDLPVDPPVKQTVDGLHDLVNPVPLFTYLAPVTLTAAWRASELEQEGGAQFGLVGLRAGKQFGNLTLGNVRTLVLTDGTDLQAQVGVSVAYLEQYLCHADDGYHFVAPLLTDLLPGGPLCAQREWLGYYAHLTDMSFSPAVGQFGLRLLDAGVLLNAAATGRTDAVWRNQATLLLGASADYADAGSVPAPEGAGWAARGTVGARLSVGTDDRALRGQLDATWRPRLGEWEDQMVQGSAALSWFAAPSFSTLFIVSLKSTGVYATRPWMVTSPAARPDQDWSVLSQLVLDVYWQG